jgi:hypothetical protein
MFIYFWAFTAVQLIATTPLGGMQAALWAAKNL